MFLKVRHGDDKCPDLIILHSSSYWIIILYPIDLYCRIIICRIFKNKENVAYLHNRILFRLEKNEILLFVGMWGQLEVMLSDTGQTQKEQMHMFPLICGNQ
jgi:hypothetical protein